MVNKNSEAIQKEIADFTAKLEASAGKKAGQKSTKGAKKELPKGKKGAPQKQVPQPPTHVTAKPEQAPEPPKLTPPKPVSGFYDFLELVKKHNFTTEQIKGFTPVDKKDVAFGKVFSLEAFSKQVVPDKYMPPEMQEYAMDVGLVAYAMLKPEWAEKIACVSKLEGVKQVKLSWYATFFNEQWGYSISNALAKEMEKATKIIEKFEPVTDAAETTDEAITAFIKTLPIPSLDINQVAEAVLDKFPLLKPGTALTTLIKNVMESMAPKDEDDKTITDFIMGLPDGLDELTVIEKVFEMFPQLPPSVHLNEVIKKAIAAKEKLKQANVEIAAAASKKNQEAPFPSVTEVPADQLTSLKELLIKMAQQDAKFSLAVVANKFKVKYDENLKHYFAAIQQAVNEGVDLKTFQIKVVDPEKVQAQMKGEMGKLLAAMEAAKAQQAEYKLADYSQFLKKLAEMVGVLAETAEYDVPPNDIVLVKEGDKYMAMTAEDALKFSVEKAGMPPPGILDEIAKSIVLKKPFSSNVSLQQPQVNLNLSIDDATAGVINKVFEMMNSMISFNLVNTSEGLKDMNEHLGELDTFVHGQLDNLKDIIEKAEQPIESEKLDVLNQNLEELKAYVDKKFSVLNMNMGKLAKQVKQKK